jgi:hypothetical protein
MAGLVSCVELADQISKDDCAAVVINNFRAWKSDVAHRMSQFIARMTAPTFGDAGDGEIGAALSWGQERPRLYSSSNLNHINT